MKMKKTERKNQRNIGFLCHGYISSTVCISFSQHFQDDILPIDWKLLSFIRPKTKSLQVCFVFRVLHFVRLNSLCVDYVVFDFIDVALHFESSREIRNAWGMRLNRVSSILKLVSQLSIHSSIDGNISSFFFQILFCSLHCTAMSCELSFTLNILHRSILNVCSVVVVFSLLTLPCILFTVFACIQFLSLTIFFYRPFAFDAKSKQWMLRTFSIHRSVCDKSIMKYQKREIERNREREEYLLLSLFVKILCKENQK